MGLVAFAEFYFVSLFLALKKAFSKFFLKYINVIIAIYCSSTCEKSTASTDQKALYLQLSVNRSPWRSCREIFKNEANLTTSQHVLNVLFGFKTCLPIINFPWNSTFSN